MSRKGDSDTGEQRQTMTEGAHKAGDGEYFFELDRLASIDAGPDYSTAHGPVIEGERMQIGLIRKPKGTGARAHTHPNEQFTYVLQGTLRAKIGDEDETLVGPGTVLYIPPETEHYTVATEEEDVVFYVVKDLSHGIIGNPVDDSTSEAHYEPGFEADEG